MPPRIVDVIERHRLTTFTSTPTMLQRIADLAGVDDRDLSSLEWIMQGAAPMPPSLVHRWADLIGAEKIIMAYGSTEALGLTVLTGLEWLEHEGSVGRGFSGAEVRILDDDGNEVATGEIGHIFVRSPNYVGATYLGEAPQLQMTDDGFGTVGDMGYLDDDDYLYLVDRRVDLIITGGANVFPAEVEAALSDHPEGRRRRRGGPQGRGVGAPRARDHRPRRPRRPADLRRGEGLHEEPPAPLQGPEVDRDRRRDPAQRSDEGQPRQAGRSPRWLTCSTFELVQPGDVT